MTSSFLNNRQTGLNYTSRVSLFKQLIQPRLFSLFFWCSFIHHLAGSQSSTFALNCVRWIFFLWRWLLFFLLIKFWEKKWRIAHIKPFTSQHQYTYSSYCSLYISKDASEENLFNNQKLLYLVIIYFTLLTLAFDLGLILLGEISC